MSHGITPLPTTVYISCVCMVSKCQLCILLLEGKCTIKRQLCIRPFRLEGNRFLYNSVLAIRTQCSTFLPVFCIPNVKRHPLEVKPNFMKTVYTHLKCFHLPVTVGFSSPGEALGAQEQHAQRNQGPED